MKKIGHITPNQIPDSVKAILKIKEDTLLFNIPLEFCKENGINPENLEFEIIKDADKIMLVAQNGTEQSNESQKPTPLKVRISNV